MRNSAKSFPVRRAAVLTMSVLLAACGGGGGGGGTPETGPSATPVAPEATNTSPPAPVALNDVMRPSAPTACRKAADGTRRTVPGVGQGEPEADAHVLGMWSPVFDFPLIPAHAALTPDGRVMSFGTTREGRQTSRFNYAVWDPKAGTGADAHLSLPNVTNTDIFCSGQVLMNDGRLLISGGDNYANGTTLNTGNADTTIFDPATNQLTQSTSMYRSRWYGTAATLGNGEVLLIGGQANPLLPVVNDRAEVRQADGTTRVLTNFETLRFNYWYPRAYTTRDGRVFGYESSGGMYFLDPAGAGRLSPIGNVGLHPTGSSSSVASFGPGKLLVAGGKTVDAVTIEYDGPVPIVRNTAPLSTIREFVNLTVLPDGNVVATGGSGIENVMSGVANHAEIWSPTTGTWTIGASGRLARLYHSVALLLPDATVMVGGGGAPGPLTNTNAELYFPPYLFEEGGKWATRPTITNAPTVLDPGAPLELTVTGPRPIARLTLVKTGAVTHSLNFDQRFVELPFTTNGTRVSARLPANTGDVSPGFWMVFAIDDRGVPSVAPVLRVNAPATQVVETGWTPSVGGQMRVNGTRFAASCEAGETMVGVRGIVSSWNMVGRVQPLCVQVDAGGRWSGTPVARGQEAGVATGTPFERSCPADSAVSGVEVRSDWGVNAMTVSCTPLSGPRTVSGAPSVALPRIAGAGTAGAPQAPVACRDGKAATGLYGMFDSQVNAVGLVCGASVVDPRTVQNTPLTIPGRTPTRPASAPTAPAPTPTPATTPATTPAAADC